MLRLYNNGARKFALNGIGALGCTPFAINSLAKKTGSRNGCTCAEKVNEAVQFFNHELILLVEHFNIHYPKAKFIYLNYFGIGSSDPVLKERKVINKSCCPLNGLGLCNTAASPCPDRKTYLFWDSFHLTEAASVLIVKRYYNSQLQSDSYPIDIKRLAELKL
ncbi:GDSL esterase/lipase At1g29670-like [Cannabis sativa]|uniref:GDSL esterase/lipase At1g29670-like n=1 Tax=Cannabis sativa TaxID=3483 RepID=UPI0029C9E8B5|nr:GDSL esterase/lipase At1g29670-like [Cannabis sativa]